MSTVSTNTGLRERLVQRDRLLRVVRQYMNDQQLIEVQTPCLSQDNVVDAHIDPVVVPGESLLFAKRLERTEVLSANVTRVLHEAIVSGGQRLDLQFGTCISRWRTFEPSQH